jgi:hypothetical protein
LNKERLPAPVIAFNDTKTFLGNDAAIGTEKAQRSNVCDEECCSTEENMIKTLQWKMDERTAKAASAYPFPIDRAAPGTQYQGCVTNTQTWNDRVVQPATWSNGSLISSPDQIIKQFRSQRYTQALALVVSWGGMGRTSQYIYDTPTREGIEHIENILRECATNIEESRCVTGSWEMLTGSKPGLGWSSVMASKTLTFLCRSLGFEQNPPVPIDRERIRKNAWPIWRDSVAFSQRPVDWDGDSFGAYGRYMTAILTWADQKHWSTAQIEATIVNIIDQKGNRP